MFVHSMIKITFPSHLSFYASLAMKPPNYKSYELIQTKSEIYSMQPDAQMFRVLHHPLEFFTTSNSTRSKSELLHSAYVGIKYLLYTHSSNGQSTK